MAFDQALDLFWIDVEAAGDDQVLGPADDRDIAAVVDHATSPVMKKPSARNSDAVFSSIRQ